MDTSETVKCELCGTEKRRLDAHLRVVHHLTPGEYRVSFPNAVLEVPGSRRRSEECRVKMSFAAKLRWASPQARVEQSERLKVSAPWTGKNLSEEHRLAISKGGKGKQHSLTEADRSSRGVKGRKTLAENLLRPEHSNLLSTAQKRRAEREGPIFGMRDPKRRSKSLDSRINNGTLMPPNSGRGICGFRVGIPHYCRSTLEANFARVLAHFGVRYNYEPKLFHLSDGTLYTPDFLLSDSIQKYGLGPGWVELKGWRKVDGTVASQTKIDCFVKDFGKPILVLAERDPLWIQISSEVGPLLPLWERPNRNLRSHPEVFGLPAFRPIVSLSETSEH